MMSVGQLQINTEQTTKGEILFIEILISQKQKVNG